MVPYLVLVIVALAPAAMLHVCKFRLAKLALKDVPVDQRVAVLDAIGRVFERWRTR